MSLLSVRETKNIEVKYRIGSGATSICYRTVDDLIWKRFILNSLYKKIIAIHNNKFAEYLDELSRLDEKILVNPQDIYLLKNHCVASYTYEYQTGTTIDRLYPKTDLEGLLKAIDELFCMLENMDYLRLQDMHYRNIMYTGDIKLIDLDMSYFDSGEDVVKNNKIQINNGIFRGIFGLSSISQVIIIDIFKEIYESMMNGEIKVSDFLREYRDYVSKEYGTCKYVKHLQKDLVREISENNKR